jgi:hypothetical protein
MDAAALRLLLVPQGFLAGWCHYSWDKNKNKKIKVNWGLVTWALVRYGMLEPGVA